MNHTHHRQSNSLLENSACGHSCPIEFRASHAHSRGVTALAIGGCSKFWNPMSSSQSVLLYSVSSDRHLRVYRVGHLLRKMFSDTADGQALPAGVGGDTAHAVHPLPAAFALDLHAPLYAVETAAMSSGVVVGAERCACMLLSAEERKSLCKFKVLLKGDEIAKNVESRLARKQRVNRGRNRRRSYRLRFDPASLRPLRCETECQAC